MHALIINSKLRLVARATETILSATRAPVSVSLSIISRVSLIYPAASQNAAPVTVFSMRRNTPGSSAPFPPSMRSQNPGTGITLSTLVVTSLLRLCELRSSDACTYRLRLTRARDKGCAENKQYTERVALGNEWWERRGTWRRAVISLVKMSRDSIAHDSCRQPVRLTFASYFTENNPW